MTHSALKNLSDQPSQVAHFSAGVVLDDALITRIEQWVVSTLDDRSQGAVEPEWMTSVDGLNLNKRRAPSIDQSSPAPTENPQGGWSRFRLTRRRGVVILSLTDQSLFKETDLAELTGDLEALVEAGHCRIVLDFFAVERLSSWACRTLDQAIRRCHAAGHALIKFSGICLDVATIFAMSGLDPSVATYPDTASAVAGHWPDLPELRPLPVSILTALMRTEEPRSCPRASTRELSRSLTQSRLHPHSSASADEDPIAMTIARLIVQEGPSMGQPVPIKSAKFVIGRGPDCQLRVGSATVSRRHATIEKRGDRFYLRDLASTNGTALNGKALRDREVEVRDGDRIRVGKLSFSLAIGPDQAGRFDDSNMFATRNDEPLRSRSIEFSSDITEESIDINQLAGEIGLKTEIIEGTLVVTPLALEIDDEAEIDTLRDALIGLSQRRLPNRVVINLAHISHLSGRAIGVLVAHHLRLDRSGGALRVCLANPRVAVVLEQVKLGMLVDYHATVEEAVIAAWPEAVTASTRV